LKFYFERLAYYTNTNTNHIYIAPIYGATEALWTHSVEGLLPFILLFAIHDRNRRFYGGAEIAGMDIAGVAKQQ